MQKDPTNCAGKSPLAGFSMGPMQIVNCGNPCFESKYSKAPWASEPRPLLIFQRLPCGTKIASSMWTNSTKPRSPPKKLTFDAPNSPETFVVHGKYPANNSKSPKRKNKICYHPGRSSEIEFPTPTCQLALLRRPPKSMGNKLGDFVPKYPVPTWSLTTRFCKKSGKTHQLFKDVVVKLRGLVISLSRKMQVFAGRKGVFKKWKKKKKRPGNSASLWPF